MKPAKRQNFAGQERHFLNVDSTKAGKLAVALSRDAYMQALENSPYKFVANTVLNPGHIHHVQEAIPFPDGTPGDVYIHKSIVLGTIRVPSGTSDGAFTVMLTPFAEAPAMVKFGGDTFYQPIADLKYCNANGTIVKACTFPHLMGVYAQRLIGKSITVENDTPEIYRAGNVTMCRMPSNVDNNTPSTTNAGAVTAVQNQRVIQTIPENAGQISLNMAATNWHARDGCYLVAQPSLTWAKRELPWEKASSAHNGTAPLVSDACDAVYVSDMNGNNRAVQASGTAYGTDTTFVPGSASGKAFAVNGQDGSDVVIAYFEGLNTTVDNIFKFKLAIVREFRLKNSSPLIQMAVPRPPADYAFLEQLLKYAAEIPGIYPADYNFWDKVWKGFKTVLSKVSQALPGVSTAIAPFLPPPAQAALGLANLVNTTGRNLISNIQRQQMVGGDRASLGPL